MENFPSNSRAGLLVLGKHQAGPEPRMTLEFLDTGRGPRGAGGQGSGDGIGWLWISTGWAPISLLMHSCRTEGSCARCPWGVLEGLQPGRWEGSGGRSSEVGSWGCSDRALMLQLCLLPVYVGNADMIQPDLAPLQPSLDDMEISGKSQPRCGITPHTAQHALHPMAAQNEGVRGLLRQQQELLRQPESMEKGMVQGTAGQGLVPASLTQRQTWHWCPAGVREFPRRAPGNGQQQAPPTGLPDRL